MELGVQETITDEMVQEYLEHHRDKPNSAKGNWILD
jgi:hypothetical protein